ncbi:uncharacterized protein LOC106177847 [Lingula anatina]|uniref:Uncharacterized protein LOC106177847 n=1 Tax=Lingula anatina TaxID=7574 RepID=A0A1S3K100_LINAN|nr:uncharacterized protein LOC106177847 [Lingula anatina]|eukprot:XP_013416207.1 uncharacterized protein LOC106177847 [Lingula anatina]
MFALDSSGSIDFREWEYTKAAARYILAIINNVPDPNSIDTNKHKFGLVRFSSTETTTVIVNLGKHPTFAMNDKSIADLAKVGYLTDTFKALTLCDTELRDKDPRLVWLFTDGLYTQGGNAGEKAEAMKKDGINICVAAVGLRAHMDAINKMASPIKISNTQNTTEKCVLNYQSFADLKYDAYSALQKVLS